jgi:hypothetical protein
LLEFAGKAPCAGYNAVRRLPRNSPARAPARGSRSNVWLEAFGIPSAARPHALADTLATAQLMLVLERKAAEQGIRTVSALRKAAAVEPLAFPRHPLESTRPASSGPCLELRNAG